MCSRSRAPPMLRGRALAVGGRGGLRPGGGVSARRGGPDRAGRACGRVPAWCTPPVCRALRSCLWRIRPRRPGCSVEVLIPDFKGDEASLKIVTDAKPAILGHNLETVERLHPDVRPGGRKAREQPLEDIEFRRYLVVEEDRVEAEVLGGALDPAEIPDRKPARRKLLPPSNWRSSCRYCSSCWSEFGKSAGRDSPRELGPREDKLVAVIRCRSPNQSASGQDADVFAVRIDNANQDL